MTWNIPTGFDKPIQPLVCDGACEEHKGGVKHVYVDAWGYFNYCEEAIVEDIRRGLKVTINE